MPKYMLLLRTKEWTIPAATPHSFFLLWLPLSCCCCCWCCWRSEGKIAKWRGGELFFRNFFPFFFRAALWKRRREQCRRCARSPRLSFSLSPSVCLFVAPSQTLLSVLKKNQELVSRNYHAQSNFGKVFTLPLSSHSFSFFCSLTPHFFVDHRWHLSLKLEARTILKEASVSRHWCCRDKYDAAAFSPPNNGHLLC